MQAVEREAGVRLDIVQKEALYGRNRIDAELRLQPRGEILLAEIKKWAPHANQGALFKQIRELPGEGILVADYVNPNMAERLRDEKIQFIDTAGNAYIDQPGHYVYVRGNKENTNQPRSGKDATQRAFEPKGLMVVYAFLCNEYLVDAPYREIADRAGVAVGTVGWVINALKAAGYIRDLEWKKGRKLVNHRRLLNRWVEAWPEKLKPKLLIGEFEAEVPYWWKQIEINELGGYWGGEIAAARYTDYIKPQEAMVYIPKKNANKLFAEARLRKMNDWNKEINVLVHVYEPFWPRVEGYLENEFWENEGLVHPILAYADLIATGDPRNHEVAKRLYEQHITQFIPED